MGIFGKPNIDKLKSKGDVKALHKVLVSPTSSPELVVDAAVALLDLDAMEPLREALHQKVSVDNIGKISNAFVAHGNEKAGPLLNDLWLEEPSKATSLDDYSRWRRDFEKRIAVRARIQSDLVKMPRAWLDDRTVAALTAVLRDRSPVKSADRATAGRCLTGVRDAVAVAALVDGLHDVFPEVRLAAAKALEGIDDAEAKAALVRLLGDTEPTVRAAVAWAAGEDVVGGLVENLAHADPSVRSKAAFALAGLGDRSGRDILIAETDSTDVEVRARAIAVVSTMLGADDILTLVKLVRDSAERVRRPAAKRLAELEWAPTMDEAGAYYFLARGEVIECLRVGTRASQPLMDYLSEPDHYGLNRLLLFEVTGEVADRRVVPILRRLLEKEKESVLRRESTDPTRLLGDPYVRRLETAITSILGRAAPVASPEWIELMDLATLPLGQALVVDLGKLDVVVVCPSCGGTMPGGAAYRSAAASFLVCPRCGDDWMIRYLTGSYERTDAAREAPRRPEAPRAADDPGSGQPTSPAPAGAREQAKETIGEPRILEGHRGVVWAVAVTPDGSHAVSGSDDKTLRVWDLASGKTLRTLEGHRAAVWDVTVTPDGRCVVSSSDDKALRVWDLASGTTLLIVEHGQWVHGVAVTPDGRHAASGGSDKTLRVWDLASGETLLTLEGHTGKVSAVAVTPDGRHAVSASADMTLRVWDLVSGETLHTLDGHSGEVRAVAVTPDGRHAVSASSDKTLRVWDLASGETLRTLEGHGGPVLAVAVTPDGRCIVSGSTDFSLRVWDLASGEMLGTLQHQGHWVTAVAVTPDGRRAVFGCGQAVRVSDLAAAENTGPT